MIRRKWLVRGGSYLGLVGLVGLGLAWMFSTHPEVVRQAVVNNLNERLRHVSINVQSSHLRLLGGIAVHELRIARSDGLDRTDFLYVPNAIVFHDKEKLAEGQLGVRKVELSRPQIRIIRDKEGRLNVKGILGPTDLTKTLPTVVARQGTIVIEDQAGGHGKPALEIKDVAFTLINDPLPTLQLEGHGQTDVLGPVTFRARITRADFSVQAHIELENVPVGPNLVERLAGFCPDVANHLRFLEGKGKVKARLTSDPDQELRYEIDLGISQGTFSHARLPHSLRNIDFHARCVNGHVPEITLKGTVGTGSLDVIVKDLTLPDHQAPDGPDLDKLVGEAVVKLHHLKVDKEVKDALPESLHWLEADYAPTGPISLTFTYHKPGSGPLVKHWLVELEGVAGVVAEFPYPLSNVRGTVEVDSSAAPERRIDFNLTGEAGKCPVIAKGKIRGRQGKCGVEVHIEGKGLVLDDKVLRALPDKGGKNVALQFLPDESRRKGLANHSMGMADFHALIYREAGQTKFANVFTVHFREASLSYDHFPYPLSDVSGTLILEPGRRWVCKGFRGRHGAGEIFVEGHSERLDALPPGGVTPPPEASGAAAPVPERIRVKISGRSIDLDPDRDPAFEEALAPPHAPERKALQTTWRTLALRGHLNFTAEVVDTPGVARDIDVSVDVSGCKMKPAFFPYTLDKVSGSVRYAKDRVYLTDVKAVHDKAEVGLRSGQILLKSAGGFTGWLSGLYGKNLSPDEDFLRALPEALCKVLGTLKLTTPVQFDLGLTLDTAAGPNSPLRVWWDGRVRLKDAAFQVGVAVSDATGQIWCEGHHDGLRLRGMNGNLLLDKAKVLDQPVEKVSAQLEAHPDNPETLRVHNLKGLLFGGTVGGQAKVQMTPVLTYEVLLEALDVKLDQFGKHNLGEAAKTAQLSGPARAAVFLSGEGADLLGLKGSGRVDVREGKMGQLPILLDLLKAFGLRVPDRTAFEQMTLIFGIEGPQVQVQQLDLYGNAISLHGHGSVDLDGSKLSLDFSATPGAIDVIPHEVLKEILKIKMRGKLGKGGSIKFDKELLPAVTEPIKRVLGAGH